MTSPGQALNTSHFWKPSEFDRSATGVYNVDKPITTQDLGLITIEETLRGRLAAAEALGSLFAHWPAELHEGNLGELFGAYLTSSSSHQISFACILIQEWSAHATAALPLPTTSPLVQRLAPIIVNALELNAATAYSETSGLLSQILDHCQHLLNIFKNKGKVPAAQIPAIASASEHEFSLDHAITLIDQHYPALIPLVGAKQRSVALPILEELATKIRTEVVYMKNMQEAMDTQVFSALAAASVALQHLPAKMNPLIRSLMNGVKFEANIDLQTRAAHSLSDFIELCNRPDAQSSKVNPSDKIIKNLCAFLCQDTTLTPLFAAHKSTPQTIFELSQDASAAAPSTKRIKQNKAAAQRATQDNDNAVISKARLIPRGAKIALARVCATYGDEVFLRVPKLLDAMSEALVQRLQGSNASLADATFNGDDVSGQEVLDCLTVVGAITPLLSASAQATVGQLLPHLVVAIQSSFALVRHVAANTYSVLCDCMPEAGFQSVIKDIVPLVADPLSLNRRRGAVEVITRTCPYTTETLYADCDCTPKGLVDRMELKILPYVIFLIVPLLGRMTDPEDDIRLLATNTFASLVKLVPLEAGLPDPPGFSADMMRKRADEREFLVQLLDGSRVVQYELPIKISITLRKYQREGVSWLAFLAKYQLHGILCDDMGLGKTLQTICIIASKTYERSQRYLETKSPDTVHLPTLVVCPPTLTGHWRQEIATYAGNLKSVVYAGDRYNRIEIASSLNKFDIIITSYDVVRNDIDILSKFQWLYCVLDEGHIIKNHKTKLSQAVKRLRAVHRLILSGTPIQNNVLELWSLFDFLMPGFLGTEEAFNRRFSKPIQQSRDARSSSREQEAGASKSAILVRQAR